MLPKIIPTPKYFTSEPGSSFRPVSFTAPTRRASVLSAALDRLRSRGLEELSSGGEIVFILGTDMLSDSDRSLFSERFASEQGYLILRAGDTTEVYAETERGLAYAALTLLQMLGTDIGDFRIGDLPDFSLRGVRWLLWAETGCWSYDFGDGADAIIKRMKRKLDMLFLYKINYVYADGFGFDADRFDGYDRIMREVSDYARSLGILIAVGGYTMSYGMVGHLNSYQGKHFMNRKSYPDGEVYDCIGTYDKKVGLKSRNRGTCLSNDALTELKLSELTEFLRRTHATSLFFHNMDADEIHPELWAARCPECRRRWKSDSLFSKDGAAGAFAEYIDKIMSRLREVKDGDYDASRDLEVRMCSPGYLYAKSTGDRDFDNGIRFWAAVADNVKDPRGFGIDFREQYFYHGKPVARAATVEKGIGRVSRSVINFPGADGFYNDHLFTLTSTLNYIMRGYDDMFVMNGNSIEEPLQLFNAEYTWRAEGSAFYEPPHPECYEDFMSLFGDMLKGRVRPPEIYSEDGLLGLITERLWGKSAGKYMREVYSLIGDDGECPIACAANVEIYTNYTKVVYPMRWDNPIDRENIAGMKKRFTVCAALSRTAEQKTLKALECYDGDPDSYPDLKMLCNAFGMGARLCRSLSEYMTVFETLDAAFKESSPLPSAEIFAPLDKSTAEYSDYIDSVYKDPLDHFEGIFIRWKEMLDFLRYNRSLMALSIAQGSRIPTGDGVRPERTRSWW